jgi:hypothetical protein
VGPESVGPGVGPKEYIGPGVGPESRPSVGPEQHAVKMMGLTMPPTSNLRQIGQITTLAFGIVNKIEKFCNKIL